MQNNLATIINGSFNGAISPLDRGLAYGDGVFRTMRVVNGVPVHWPMHYQALVENCSAIGLVCPSAELFMSDFQQLFLVDEEVAVAKLIVTRGDGERGYAPPAITAPTRIIIKCDMPNYPEKNLSQGVHLHVCETRLAHQPKLAGVKHLNRLENVLARMEWSDPAIAEGLMLDTADNVIECISANIFARFNDKLITPSLDQCGVAGITRQQILSRAKTFSLKTEIAPLSLEQLLTADEVIICNSLYGAWQVRGIAKQEWPQMPLAADIRMAVAS